MSKQKKNPSNISHRMRPNCAVSWEKGFERRPTHQQETENLNIYEVPAASAGLRLGQHPMLRAVSS